MNWTKVAEFPADAQLHTLHLYLQQQGVAHRITEEGGQQVLWLANPAQVGVVQHYFARVQAGDTPRVVETAAEPKGNGTLALAFDHYPLTLLIAMLGVFGYAVHNLLNLPGLEGRMMFLPLSMIMENGQIWRLITPVFLHFSLMHILFNALWIWELGRRIEIFAGGRQLLMVFLITGIGSNYLQFLISSSNNFGGLSGVVYGFLGYVGVCSRYHPSPLLKMPPGLYVFMLVWLALGFAGLIDYFIPGSVANGAHLGGLIAGAAVGAAQVADWRRKQGR